MFDPERLLGQMLGQGMGLGHGGRGKRRRGHGHRSGSMVNKAQLGVGLLGVAIAAWEHYNGQQKGGAVAPSGGSVGPPPPPPAGTAGASGPSAPPPPPAAVAAGVPANAADTRPAPLAHPSRADAEHLLRTMVAAASADGEVDAAERAAILEQARQAGGVGEDLAWLQRELALPLSVESIIDATRGGLREATYAAAVAALDVDLESERRWLQRLADGLRLTPSERDAIERAVLASREG